MRIRTDDDLDLKKIADSGQCFRWKELESGCYRVIHRGRSLIIRYCPSEMTYELDCTVDEFGELWRDYLDLDENYAMIRRRIDPERDPFLYAASEHEKGIRILRQDPWEALISFIISQNRNIPAIKRSIELLCELAGEPAADSTGEVYYAFPTPEAVAELSMDDLSACRLGYRDSYVSGAARAVVSGELDLSETSSLLSCEDKMARLMEIKGIGRKVASCIVLYGFHDMDSFPVDVWVKRILADHYPDGYPFERYSPYNGLCQQYMFAYYRELAGSR